MSTSRDDVWVSVSQISTFNACKRKWAGQKLFRLPEPERAAASMGTEVHAELENKAKAIADVKWYAPKKHAQLVENMWAHVPALVDAEFITEARLELPVIDGVRLLGFADLLIRYPDRKSGVVLDYKTTKSKRYIKAKKTLETGDLQAAVYQHYGRTMWPDHNWVCHWITGLTDGSNKVTSTTAKITNETVDRVWSHVQEASSEIVQLRRSAPKHFEDVEPTFGDACKAFGGCPFADRCNNATQTEVERDMTNSRSALLARIAAAKKNVAAATPAADPAPNTTGAIQENSDGTTTVPVVDPEGPTPEPEVDPINPPEAATVPEKAEPDPAPAKDEKPKAKRGRKPKAKADPAPEGPTPADPVPESTIAADLAGPVPSLRVYVDCFPIKGDLDILLLSDLVEGPAAKVCASAEVKHWSLAEFGSGKGGLVAEMEAAMPRDCAVYINSFTEEGKVLLPLFERHAYVVVKG